MPAARIILALLAAGSARPLTRPASAPAPRQWGRSGAGLSVSVAAVGPWVLGRPLRADVAIRNTGSVAASLGRAEKTHGFLLIVQGGNVYYTENLPRARAPASRPAALAPGRVHKSAAVDVGRLKAHAYAKGMKFVDGYPAYVVEGQVRRAEPLGTLGSVLQPGPVRLKYVFFTDRGREGKIRLDSRILRLTVELPAFGKLSPPERRRVLDQLVRRMRKDAFSAKLAHADAVRIGPAAVAALTGVLTDERSPGFARMWSATALADIGGPAAADVLIESLTDPSPGVRHVAAYHGLKARSGKFEKALVARARSLADPGLTAWAIRGYLAHRRRAPAGLVEAALESDSVRVRATVARTLAASNPGRRHLSIFRRLAADRDAGVRVTAARTLGLIGDKSFATIDALVSALGMSGDRARHAAAGALVRLTGRNWPYLAAWPDERKRAAVERWKQWWAGNKDLYRGRTKPPRSP